MCKKEFNPQDDFYEDAEACEALMYFTDIDNMCGECTGNLRDDIKKFVNSRGVVLI
jgi:hypothetical protein